MSLSLDVIKKLPKTDLHCHYDGSVRLSSVIELARRHGVRLFSYDPDALMAHMKYGRVRETLEEYLAGFPPITAVLQEADDIERTFFEVCADAAAENVWHLELRYCPLLLTEKGLRGEEVVAACIRAAERAERQFNMTVRHILCGLKHMPSSALTVAELAVRFFDHGVVGFDLAGPEKGYPFSDHSAGITLAKRHHLFITMHAGESTGPETITEALHDAGAHRIGHGVSLIENERLLNYVINHRIGIEACPLSNLHTGAIKSLREHPLRQWLERGVRVSLNTDNRLCSDTTMTRELSMIIEALDLSVENVHQLLLNGFKSAFLPHEKRRELIRRFEIEWRTMAF